MPFLLMTSSCSCVGLQSFLNGEGKTLHSGSRELVAAGAEVPGPEAAAQVSAAVPLWTPGCSNSPFQRGLWGAGLVYSYRTGTSAAFPLPLPSNLRPKENQHWWGRQLREGQINYLAVIQRSACFEHQDSSELPFFRHRSSIARSTGNIMFLEYNTCLLSCFPVISFCLCDEVIM